MVDSVAKPGPWYITARGRQIGHALTRMVVQAATAVCPLSARSGHSLGLNV